MVADTRFVKGAAAVSARLKKVRKDIRDTIGTDKIPALLLRRTKDRFNRQVDPDEKPWAPLERETLERKRRGTGRRKILHDTLGLKQSIGIIRGDASGTIFSNTGASARIGVEDPVVAAYARFHQTGTGGQKQRRFLGIGSGDVAAVDLLLKNAIIRANGLKVTR